MRIEYPTLAVIGVDTLYTEDMDDGMTYGTVKVVNPFASPQRSSSPPAACSISFEPAALWGVNWFSLVSVNQAVRAPSLRRGGGAASFGDDLLVAAAVDAFDGVEFEGHSRLFVVHLECDPRARLLVDRIPEVRMVSP